MFEKFMKAIEFLGRLGIEPDELVCVNCNTSEVTCQLQEAAFARIAKQLFVLDLWHHECSPSHFRFNVQGVEFVTVSYSVDFSGFRISAKTPMEWAGV